MADVVVLAYHASSPTWSSPLSVAPELIADHVAALQRRGYRAVTFGDALRLAEGSERLVCVTFDDGYRSNVSGALPALSAIGAVATIFVPTSFVGSERPLSWPGIEEWLGTPDESELIPAGWNELRLLADAGWEVGSHTVTHPRLTQLDEHRLAVELDASRAEVERQLGRPCLSLAYPYGDYDERVVSAAGAAGYRHACTLPAALEPERPLAWPRIGIYGTDTPFSYRLKVSRSARRVRASAAWDALSAVRSRIQRSGRTGSATG